MRRFALLSRTIVFGSADLIHLSSSVIQAGSMADKSMMWACRKVTDFVRRRRWVRSQRPVTTSEDDDLARPTVAPTGGEEEGAVLGSSPSPVRRPPKLLEALSFPKPAPVSSSGGRSAL